MRLTCLGLFVFVLVIYNQRSPVLSQTITRASSPRWTWTCDAAQRVCRKLQMNSSLSLASEARCRASCGPETSLWPLPLSLVMGGVRAAEFSPDLVIKNIGAPSQGVEEWLSDAIDFQLKKLSIGKRGGGHSSSLQSVIAVEVKTDGLDIDLDTKEDYELSVRCDQDANNIQIRADTYFGARHALETLFQMIHLDSYNLAFLVSCDVTISDGPHFSHRGVMLDTARNFVSVDMIKTLIDSMSYSKMNVFHWHITDSQSFPLYFDSLPEFAEFGAYSPEMTYNKWDVEEIVRYAARRGVRVLPEFDSPAHVGAGWEAVDSSYTLCVNREPWEDWCVEPPCGQLNPTQSGMFDVLEAIFAEMLGMFGVKQFHMGGDEIHLGCWNSSEEVVSWLQEHGRGREEADFMFLWSSFLQESVKRIQKAGMTPNLVYWTNGLTKPEYISYLDPKLFTVQIWSNGQDYGDLTIRTVAEAGFKMIISNYDATYLDCGFGGWVNTGNNWCSPYKEWQLQHGNDPYRLLEMRGVNNLEEAKSNVMGGEVAMWTETSDGHTMMTRIEPRASAYAERLWRGPATGGWVEAERRLVRHRERLVTRGVPAETLTHGWCRQHEGKCLARDAGMEPFF